MRKQKSSAFSPKHPCPYHFFLCPEIMEVCFSFPQILIFLHLLLHSDSFLVHWVKIGPPPDLVHIIFLYLNGSFAFFTEPYILQLFIHLFVIIFYSKLHFPQVQRYYVLFLTTVHSVSTIVLGSLRFIHSAFTCTTNIHLMCITRPC